MKLLRFDRSFNAGQVAAVASSLVLIGGLIFQQGRFQAQTEVRLAATEAVNAQYVPVIHDVVSATKVTNDRFNAIATSLDVIRTETGSIKSEASAIRERLVAIETTVGLNPLLQKQGMTYSPRPPRFPLRLETVR